MHDHLLPGQLVAVSSGHVVLAEPPGSWHHLSLLNWSEGIPLVLHFSRQNKRLRSCWTPKKEEEENTKEV